jgi:hypothetical protein
MKDLLRRNTDTYRLKKRHIDKNITTLRYTTSIVSHRHTKEADKIRDDMRKKLHSNLWSPHACLAEVTIHFQHERWRAERIALSQLAPLVLEHHRSGDDVNVDIPTRVFLNPGKRLIIFIPDLVTKR